ncbi:matrixin family metalloprotease [Micromonospora sp. WMMD1155]|uniref:matrixin family metalloprotease n=1 Tax=Micromonospora sp. WMMD1155 TaxID=3016094 RepID=UPI00249AEC02|nr:matrixin family metalloprotease [Micromonospora sp. WMMD1155]WFE54940.1 matrixin family metalloprotease [Micromonospora sp. WMMD1155]
MRKHQGSNRRLKAGLVAAAGAAMIAVPAPAPAVAAPTALAAACDEAQIPAAILLNKTIPLVSDECDLRGKVVRAGVIGAAVPQKGEVVTAHALYVEGVKTGPDMPDSVSVRVDKGAVTVEVRHEGSVARGDGQPSGVSPGRSSGTKNNGSAQATAATPECSQNAYSLMGRYNGYHKWYFKSDTVPAYFGGANLAETDILSASYNIDVGMNDCGLTQTMGTDFEYAGYTLDYPDITSTPACDGARSNKNEVAFGPIDNTNILAVTCGWSYSWPGDDPIQEADILFANRPNQFFYFLPSGCNQRYELQGVATHEFGHAFGLDHVSESSYPALTMSTNATSCSYRDSSLGLGDYNGLRAIYGS